MAHYTPPVQGKMGQLIDVIVLVVLTVGALFVPLWMGLAGSSKTVATPVENPTWETLGQNPVQAAQYEALGYDPAGAHDLAPHAEPRGHHERDHGAAEGAHDPRHDARLTERHVHPRQRDDQEQARQDEQPTAGDRAAHAVQAVAEVARELLRLGSGQGGAEPQCVEERAFVDPLAALDDLTVHQVDLGNRSAERDAAEPQPHAQRCPERRGHVVAPPIAQPPRRVRAPPSPKRIRMNSVMPTQRPVRPQPR